MKLYEKDFWCAKTFEEAFRKVTQYESNEKEAYLRNTYLAYQLLIGTIRERQPDAHKLLDYGSGFGIGWMIGTMEGFSVHCADIGNFLDFFPATNKYRLPHDLDTVRAIQWDAICLVGILSYIPREKLDEFIDALLEMKFGGLYLMGWIEGDQKTVHNRHGVEGHVYERKRVLPLLRKRKFDIVDEAYPLACLVK